MLSLPSVYDEDPAAVIHGALSVSCDGSAMTVAIPRRISNQVGGISMSLSDRSCIGVMNKTHLYITERFDRCKFKKQMSLFQTTYTNYVSWYGNVCFVVMISLHSYWIHSFFYSYIIHMTVAELLRNLLILSLKFYYLQGHQIPE